MENILALQFPEIVLALTLMGLLFCEIGYHGERVRLVNGIVLVGLCAALAQALTLYRYAPVSIEAFGVYIDGVSIFFKLLFIVAGVFVALFGSQSEEIGAKRKNEFYIFVVGGVLTGCLIAQSTSLVLIYLGLGALSLIASIMAGFGKRAESSSEAGIKTFYFSLISSCLFLISMGWIYLNTGSFDLAGLRSVLQGGGVLESPILFSSVFLVAALTFYLASFPVYLWFPDSIEGAPGPSSAFLALLIPLAGLVVLLRVIATLIWGFDSIPSLDAVDLRDVVAFISAATMLIGGLLAIRQSDLKRMASCLIVVESGVAILGLLVDRPEMAAASLFKVFVNLFALVGIFVCLGMIRDRKANLFDGDPKFDFLALLFFFGAVIGMPPFSGFLGKYLIVSTAIDAGRWVPAGVCLVATVLSAYAFARVAIPICKEVLAEAREPTKFRLNQRHATLMILGFPVLVLGFFAEPLLMWARQSLQIILW